MLSETVTNIEYMLRQIHLAHDGEKRWDMGLSIDDEDYWCVGYITPIIRSKDICNVEQQLMGIVAYLKRDGKL